MAFHEMESAPKDGTRVMLFVNGRIRPGFWSAACDSWMVIDDFGGCGECFPDGWRACS